MKKGWEHFYCQCRRRLDRLRPLFFWLAAGLSILSGCGAADEVRFLEGRPAETEGYILDSGRPGPEIYLVAGIHGNEHAGVLAAETLRAITLKKGRLVILPRANRPAVERNSRALPSCGDLNRAFPGRKPGLKIQELAYAIYSHIASREPDIVLDLHESEDHRTGAIYALGNTLIFSHHGLPELAAGAVTSLNQKQKRKQGRAFVYLIEALSGTLNAAVTENLNIPVITCEADSGRSLEERVETHLDFVRYVLNYYDMLDRY